MESEFTTDTNYGDDNLEVILSDKQDTVTSSVETNGYGNPNVICKPEPEPEVDYCEVSKVVQ